MTTVPSRNKNQDKDSSSTQRQTSSGNPSPSAHTALQGQTPFEAVLEYMNNVLEQMANFAEQFEKFNLRLDNIQNRMTQLENEWNDACTADAQFHTDPEPTATDPNNWEEPQQNMYAE